MGSRHRPKLLLPSICMGSGKFAERARPEVPDETLQTYIRMYVRGKFADGKPSDIHTHKHAAYTALAWGYSRVTCAGFGAR